MKIDVCKFYIVCATFWLYAVIFVVESPQCYIISFWIVLKIVWPMHGFGG